MTEEESNQILAEVDADHSGQVDFDEFKLYWVKAKQAGPGEPTRVIPSFTHFLPIFPRLSPIFSVWTREIQGTRPEAQGKTGKIREKSAKIGVIKSLGAPGWTAEGNKIFGGMDLASDEFRLKIDKLAAQVRFFD